MIPRYENKKMAQIWAAENKFKFFLEVELAILQCLENDPSFAITAGTTKKLQQAKINPTRINEIENEVKHDVIAFCTSITEQFPADVGRFFHYGVTSSDVIDTALTLQIKSSLDLFLPSLKELIATLHAQSNFTKNWISMGRSHGMNAEPMSFGQKWLGFFHEFKRRLNDYQSFYETELTGQFSGAVGNYTILTPAVEQKALQNLGLKVEPVSTQIIPRDRIAKLVSLGGLLASAIERLSVEIRHLHHSDIGELHEGFTPGQKGSSIMPHKKNPIATENLSGLARVLRSHVLVALENCILWHERDISHSSAERLFLPDHFGLLIYSIERLNQTVKNLVFDREKIESKVTFNTQYLSSVFLHHLIKHTQEAREKLYPIVQAAAFSAPPNDNPELFWNRIKAECVKSHIKLKNEMKNLNFNLSDLYLKHIDEIFSRT
jgi:adenylosuccinate lyase